MNRRDDSCWIQAFTGRRFTPLDPNPDDICVVPAQLWAVRKVEIG